MSAIEEHLNALRAGAWSHRRLSELTPDDRGALLVALARAKPTLPRDQFVTASSDLLDALTRPPQVESVPAIAEAMDALLDWQLEDVVPVLARASGPIAVACFCKVVERVPRGTSAFRALIRSANAALRTDERVLPLLFDRAERDHMLGTLALTLLSDVEGLPDAKRALAPIRDRLADAASRQRRGKPMLGDRGPWARPTADLLAELCERAGVTPKSPPPSDLDTKPTSPIEEASFHDVDGSLVPYAPGDWMTRLAARFEWPRLNAYWLWRHAARTPFTQSRDGQRARDVAIAEALVEGFAESRAIAGRLGIALPPRRDDPFDLDARRGTEHASPKQERFQKHALGLGSVLLEGGLGAWARERTLGWMRDLECVTEREKTERALADALAAGALLFYAAYGVTLPPFAPLVAAAIDAGAFAKPKAPSIAKIQKAYPRRACFPLSASTVPPKEPDESAVNPTGEAPSPWKDAPPDATFVGFVKLTTPTTRFVALYHRDGRHFAIERSDAPASVDPRLRALRQGARVAEPASAAWAKLRTPDLFGPSDRIDDAETTLGAYQRATEEKTVSRSKIGGYYVPVQGSLRFPPTTRRAELLFQLGFDDGARLPDAGLVYVFEIEHEDGRTELLVHEEHA